MVPTKRHLFPAALVAAIVWLTLTAPAQSSETIPVVIGKPTILAPKAADRGEDWEKYVYILPAPFDQYGNIEGRFYVWLVDTNGARIGLKKDKNFILTETNFDFSKVKRDQLNSEKSNFVLLVPAKNSIYSEFINYDKPELKWLPNQQYSNLEIKNPGAEEESAPETVTGPPTEDGGTPGREYLDGATPETGPPGDTPPPVVNKPDIIPKPTRDQYGEVDEPDRSGTQEENDMTGGKNRGRDAIKLILLIFVPVLIGLSIGLLIKKKIIQRVRGWLSRSSGSKIDLEQYRRLQAVVKAIMGNQKLMDLIENLGFDNKQVQRTGFEIIQWELGNKLAILTGLYEMEKETGVWGPYFSSMATKINGVRESIAKLSFDNIAPSAEKGGAESPDVLGPIQNRLAQAPKDQPKNPTIRQGILDIMFKSKESGLTEIMINSELKASPQDLETELNWFLAHKIITAKKDNTSQIYYSLGLEFDGLFRLGEFWEFEAFRKRAEYYRTAQTGGPGKASKSPTDTLPATPSSGDFPREKGGPASEPSGYPPERELTERIERLNRVIEDFVFERIPPVQPQVVFQLEPLKPNGGAKVPASNSPEVDPATSKSDSGGRGAVPFPRNPQAKSSPAPVSRDAKQDRNPDDATYPKVTHPPAPKPGHASAADFQAYSSNPIGPSIGKPASAGAAQARGGPSAQADRNRILDETGDQVKRHLRKSYQGQTNVLESAEDYIHKSWGELRNQPEKGIPFQAIKTFVNACYAVSPHEEELERIMGEFIKAFNIGRITAAPFGKPSPPGATSYKKTGTDDTHKAKQSLIAASAQRNIDDKKGLALQVGDVVKTVHPRIEFPSAPHEIQEMMVQTHDKTGN